MRKDPKKKDTGGPGGKALERLRQFQRSRGLPEKGPQLDDEESPVVDEDEEAPPAKKEDGDEDSADEDKEED